MGIGNHVERGLSTISYCAHYPSWGSETARSISQSRRASAAHYPSWGSETRATPPFRGHDYISLPLMGIGSLIVSAVRMLPGIHSLPSWGSETWYLVQVDRHGGYDSLPLMGIGNLPTSRCGYGGNTRLITPHGDRKRGIVRAIADLTRASSLPLMGIGNPWRRRRSGGWRSPSLPLMGIGNVRLRGRRLQGSGPHYPSWGSETQHMRATAP